MRIFGKVTSMAELAGWIAVLLVVHVAYAREVLLQVRVQSRLYASLPSRIRGSFPDHPASARTVGFGSLQFLRAYLHYILTDTPDDSADVAAFKTELRASSRRERWFACLGVAALLAFVIALWRR